MNPKQNPYIFIQENAVENVVCETAAILFRPQCVKNWIRSLRANYESSQVAILHMQREYLTWLNDEKPDMVSKYLYKFSIMSLHTLVKHVWSRFMVLVGVLFTILTHLPLVPHKGVGELGKQWFRQWLVACSVPAHHLNQCWNSGNWTLGNKLQWNLNLNSYIFIQENVFEKVVCEMTDILTREGEMR